MIRRTVPFADGALLPLTAVLTAFGVTTIYRLDPDDGGRQAVWIAVGVAALVGTLIWLRHDYRVLESYRYLFGVGAIALLLLPSVPGLGETVNGARLWVDLGVIQFQPGELAKICLILFLAGYLREKRESLARGQLKDIGPLLAIWGAAMLVIVVTNDLGSALLNFGIFLAMLYVATGRALFVVGGARAVPGRRRSALQRDRPRAGPRHDLAAALDGGAGLLLDHGRARAPPGLRVVPAREEPLLDRQRRLRSAPGSARGRSRRSTARSSSRTSAPTSSSRRSRRRSGWSAQPRSSSCSCSSSSAACASSLQADDGFSKLLAAGLTFGFALQTFIIVGGVLRVVPLTGITLPFVSYGGTSIVANFVLLALAAPRLRPGEPAAMNPQIVRLTYGLAGSRRGARRS